MKKVIYALINPETDQIFYVGATTNLKNRMFSHCTLTVSRLNPHKRKTPVCIQLEKMIINNIRPVVRILEYIPETDKTTEYKWINYYKAIGVNLCNVQFARG